MIISKYKALRCCLIADKAYLASIIGLIISNIGIVLIVYNGSYSNDFVSLPVMFQSFIDSLSGNTDNTGLIIVAWGTLISLVSMIITTVKK